MKKKVLVTAGNTSVPIDKVRSLGNIFKGKTGTAIAEYFAGRGHEVTLLTSHPELVSPRRGLVMARFVTFSNLILGMEGLIREEPFDIIIHSAAVSDYEVGGIYRQLGDAVMVGERTMRELEEINRSGKIASDHDELWMKLTPTVKIVDLIREPWGFKGLLVKFKLQVGMSDTELIEVATKSMRHSKADFIVANTLEGMSRKAFIISSRGNPTVEVERHDLPIALYREVMA